MISKMTALGARLVHARGKRRQLWLLVLPALMVRAATMLYPICVTFYYSFLDYRMIKRVKEWGGLKNYIKLFRDPSIKATMGFTVQFTLCSMACIFVLGILFGLLLNVRFRGKSFLRSIALIP